MLPNKDGTMLKVPREPRKPFSFKKKDNELMQGYVDVSIGNYVVLDPEQPNIRKQKEEIYFKCFWRMYFDGACSSLGCGVGIVIKVIDSIIHPLGIILEFPCTNNEEEYETLVQGMILGFEMKIENFIITMTLN